jgi:hypothetical protein
MVRLRPRATAPFFAIAATITLVFACGSPEKSGFTSDGGGGPMDASHTTADVVPTFGDTDSSDDAPSLFQGDGSGCTPKTCAQLGYTCGNNNDGCGNVIMCGTCSGQICGGGGYSRCGGPVCTPATCAALGYNCGPAGDGCGGLLQCGACSGPAGLTCGGSGQPGVCGGGGGTCTNLCQQQVTCDGGAVTTITGRVLAGVSPYNPTQDPVPNVVVYVPNASIQPFAPGVQCSQCGAEVSGSPLVMTTTAYDGTFSLANVPVSQNNVPIPVVIQLGRWRREFSIPINSACASTPIGDLNLPTSQTQGDIPLTAISTGSADILECVLLKMGIDAAEFTPQGGAGRVHLYSSVADVGRNSYGALYSPGVNAGAGTTGEQALLGAGGSYMNYDQILLPCWGAEAIKNATELANLVSYANAGGRFFATHWSYTWLFQNTPFSQVAQWDPQLGGAVSAENVQLPPVNSEGTTFSKWLGLVGALSQANPPQLEIADLRRDVDAINPGSVNWIDYTDSNNSHGQALLTFGTPWGETSQCGRGIYSDFHVVAYSMTSPSDIFPSECVNGNMTAEEKVLEYMIWDLASCTPPPPACTPRTCMDQNISCGPAGDGCGGLLQCGTCQPPQTCGGGGTPGQCGGEGCVPATCEQLGLNCGPVGTGCGGLLQCGTCQPPETCGGGGTPGQCGGSTPK